MSNDTFYLVQYDRQASVLRTLKINKVAIDLSLAESVTFQLADQEGVIVAEGECVVVTAASGVVRYDWADGDTDQAGYFQARFVINWPSDLPQTVPNNGVMSVVISQAFTDPV